ncbi:hypothetical protein [Burkholderia sp. JKS000303]|uniref:hypothetical protein n=1 Tax=Burkholderia sp. JKS000303 TaxID=1938747 RepID=UPI00211D2C3F|nr:hypothetical protein [Burkholderia sp. JKS000303]
MTKDEFIRQLSGFFPDADPVPIEETKVDRNLVPYREPGLRRVRQMPEFDAPTDVELRQLWRTHHDPEVRRLILEIVALRKSLYEIMNCWQRIDRVTADYGDLGGAFGHWRKLFLLVRDEMRRAGISL